MPAYPLLLILLLAVAVLTPAASGQDPGPPTGRQIMQWVNDREDGDNETSRMEMVLIDKSGNQRVRRMKSSRKDAGPDRMSLLFFVAPADVKNTGFLSYDYIDVERDDDQWLYLPALKKTKRIAGGDRGGSFMGSDFTYSDMSKPALDRYTYTLMKEVTQDGVELWQVEAIPNEKEAKETGYTRSINFIRKDNHMLVRSVSFLKKGKRLKYFSVEKLEEIDG
ncbi:MAG: outer membrane lipoprotein-sorting protein, partial [Myxococcota bacterium]|nr:outer membrane lipoprotein-sorting protein [Myxococcota bacterium]